jgi:hypothetical protein
LENGARGGEGLAEVGYTPLEKIVRGAFRPPRPSASGIASGLSAASGRGLSLEFAVSIIFPLFRQRHDPRKASRLLEATDGKMTKVSKEILRGHKTIAPGPAVFPTLAQEIHPDREEIRF